MIIKFSDKIYERWYSIIRNNKKPLAFFVVWAVLMYFLEHVLQWDWISMPMAPVALLGGGLAIFLGFRNNSAYDRWWEARKIWGGMVNISRTFSMNVISFLSENDQEAKVIVNRHLAFTYALKNQLREKSALKDSLPFILPDELPEHESKANKATSLLTKQGQQITQLKVQGKLDGFEHQTLMKNIETMFDYQGMSERIKKTVFPFFYKYFTRTFLWLFLIVLPGSLVHEMSWHAIPLAVAISFVYMILDRIGDVTENPLDGRSSGTPLNAICRTIEIDLLQQLGEENIPEPYPVKETRHKSKYLD
jgi:putative membrane protein